MLQTSFTIRPATTSAEGMKDAGGVEVTLRDTSKTNIAKPTMIHNSHHQAPRRVSAEENYQATSGPAVAAGAATNLQQQFYNPYPQPQKRQKRVFAEHHHPHYPHPHPHALHTIPLEETSQPPRIRRIPFDFEPPSREEYWKQRCLRMQGVYYESRYRLKEMKEDQRQMRRRIQELEKHLLHSGLNGSSAKEEEDDDANSLTLDDSREEEDEEDPRRETEPEERVASSAVPKKSSKNQRRLPAFLKIPKCMPAAACFYLTDGEGLSDSELLDEEEEDYPMDERE